MGAHGGGKGGSRRPNFRNSGKGASRKGGGREHHRKSQRLERRGSDRGRDHAARQDIDDVCEQVCHELSNLPSLDTDNRRFALARLYTGHFKNPEALANSFPEGSAERRRLQSALEKGLPYFSEVHRNKAVQVLSEHGFKLNLKWDAKRGRGSGAGSSRALHVQELRREHSGRDDRAEARPAQKRHAQGRMGHKLKKMQKQRCRGEDPEDHRRHDNFGRQGGKGGAPPRRDKKRKPSINDEHMRPGRGAKKGRTGANTIDVDWKPPPKESEDEEKVDGVTPKSKPPSPPKSPVRGPAGRHG